jgi:hypothetical protein
MDGPLPIQLFLLISDEEALLDSYFVCLHPLLPLQ